MPTTQPLVTMDRTKYAVGKGRRSVFDNKVVTLPVDDSFAGKVLCTLCISLGSVSCTNGERNAPRSEGCRSVEDLSCFVSPFFKLEIERRVPLDHFTSVPPIASRIFTCCCEGSNLLWRLPVYEARRSCVIGSCNDADAQTVSRSTRRQTTHLESLTLVVTAFIANIVSLSVALQISTALFVHDTFMMIWSWLALRPILQLANVLPRFIAPVFFFVFNNQVLQSALPP